MLENKKKKQKKKKKKKIEPQSCNHFSPSSKLISTESSNPRKNILIIST